MEAKKVFVLCKAGGVFEQAENGSISYRGGNARTIRIDNQIKFDELKEVVARRIECSSSTMSFIYIIPNTLVTVSNDEDVGEMIEYHEDLKHIELYVNFDEIPSVDTSDMQCIQSSLSILPEAIAPAYVSYLFEDDQMDDTLPPEMVEAFTSFLNGDNQVDNTVPEVILEADVSLIFEDNLILDDAVLADISLLFEDNQLDAIPEDIVLADVSLIFEDNLILDDAVLANVPFDPFEDFLMDYTVSDDPFLPSKDYLMDDLLPETISPADDPSLLIVDNQVEGILPEVISDPIESRPDGDPNDVKLNKAFEPWKNIITGVGQTFSSASEFRESLDKHAWSHNYEFKFGKNNSTRVNAKCESDGCLWSVHASKLSTDQLFCIKKMSPIHTCDRAAETTKHRRIPRLVAGIIKEKLKVLPTYRPKDIVNDIKEEYGIQITPLQASRAKEMVEKDIFTEEYGITPLQASRAKEMVENEILTEEYCHLKVLCENIIKENPRNTATLTSKGKFVFVSFHVSLVGFQQSCRPILCLYSTILTNSNIQEHIRYLLIATTSDGDNQVFPVAFGLVDMDPANKWHWFLQQLKSCLSVSSPITFVANFSRYGLKDAKKAISNVFPGSFNAFCLHCLYYKLSCGLKREGSTKENIDLVRQLFFDAANASRTEEFEECLERIKKFSTKAHIWISEIGPINWRNTHSPDSKVNFMRSDYSCSEIFTPWECRVFQLPITQLLKRIPKVIMKLFIKRWVDSSQWMSRLTPSMEARLEQERLKAGCLEISSLAGGSTYEVVSGDSSTVVVDIDKWDCSCRRWQLTGIPCCHAIAVILSTDRPLYDYCSRLLTIENYKETYSESASYIESSSMIAGFIKQTLKVLPTYKPKDIENDIEQEYGIQLTTLQSWRAKEMAKKAILTEEYSQLKLVCENIIKENPGNKATLTSKDGLTYNHLFVSLHVSLFGFHQYCRPFIYLYQAILKGRMLFNAITSDGHNQKFPVAIGVVDVEAENSWEWFLQQLKSCLSISSPITFVADRRCGLNKMISDIFPGSVHTFCPHYLARELSENLEGLSLTKENLQQIGLLFYAAANASRSEEFQECLQRIKDISNKAYIWIRELIPMNWAAAFFPGSIFNFTRSDYFTKMVYKWERKSYQPTTELLERMLNMIMKLFIKRRADSSQWMSMLTPSMEARLEQEKLKVGCLEIKSFAGSTYEVVSDDSSTVIVDIDKWGCSCRQWQLTGIPCCHALAVIRSTDRSPYDYCSEYFTTEKYKMTYSESASCTESSTRDNSGLHSSRNVRVSAIYKLVMFVTNSMGESIPLRMQIENGVVSADSCEIYVPKEDLLHFCTLERISDQVLVVYMRFQHLKLRSLNTHSLYLLVEPDRATDLAVTMKSCQNNQLIVYPYIPFFHRMLVVIDLFDGIVYFFDPLESEQAKRDLMSFITTAYSKWRCRRGEKTRMLSWSCVKCLMQSNYIESDYFVMKCMKDLFEIPRNSLKNWFDGEKNYSMNDVNEMREEFAEYILKWVNC